MRSKAFLLAALGALPAGIIGLVSLIHFVPSFFDPCLHWAAGERNASHNSNSRSGSFASHAASLPPPSAARGPCADRVAFIGETRGHAVTRLILVQGGLLMGCVFGIAGALYSLRWLTIVGVAILVIESIPLMSLAPITLLGALLLLLSTQTNQNWNRS